MSRGRADSVDCQPFRSWHSIYHKLIIYLPFRPSVRRIYRKLSIYRHKRTLVWLPERALAFHAPLKNSVRPPAWKLHVFLPNYSLMSDSPYMFGAPPFDIIGSVLYQLNISHVRNCTVPVKWDSPQSLESATATTTAARLSELT